MCKRHVLSVLFTLFCLCAIPSTAFSAPGISPGIPEPGRQDVIVQLFNWPFSAVTEAMPQLKAGGYGFVLISPPQKGLENGRWWGRYQPKDFSVLESSLGDEASFREMACTARENGLVIMADAVINHTGTGTAICSQDGLSVTQVSVPGFSPSDFHPPGASHDEKDQWLFGMPDIATDRPETRKKLASYLRLLLDLGAGALRVDAAAHIPPAELQAIIQDTGSSNPPYVIGEIARTEYADFKDYLSQCPDMDFYDFPLPQGPSAAHGRSPAI